jgi:ABC-type dipeptide/oligopeptide/nickel transport system permease component
MDEDMDPIEAVEGSWRLTRGHAWQVFGLYFLAIPIFFIGLLLMVVGVIPALMWISSAFSAMYLSVSGSKNEPEETAPEDSGNPANTTDSLDA